MQFRDYFDGEPGDYGLSEEVAQLIVDFCLKIEASEFDLEPTRLPIGSPSIKTNLIVVSFRSQRRRWQLWVTGQPVLTLTFQGLMSNMREADHTELSAVDRHTPAAFNTAWQMIQEVEAGPVTE